MSEHVLGLIARDEHRVLSRGELQRALTPFRQPPNVKALVAVGQGLVLYVGLVAGVLLLGPMPWRLACSLAIAPTAGRLFMRAHDAGHDCLTSSRALNEVLGRICFLPTFHAFSIWVFQHNKVHHAFTNLRSRDFIWAPLSPREYAALLPRQQARYRFYRRTAGFALYQLLELWWKRFLFPPRQDLPRARRAYRLDQFLVLGFFGSHLFVAGTTSAWLALPLLQSLMLAVLVPMALFNFIAGFVGYFHHTHPAVAWYETLDEWRGSSQLDTAVQTTFSPVLSRLAGDVMEHPAHHIEPRISLARLRPAQGRLNELVGRAGRSQRWSWRAHAQIVGACKLYDFESRCWRDFSGRAMVPQVTAG